MSRPKGSRNAERQPERRQRQIRLEDSEYAAMVVAARLLGMTWSEWARQGLRQLAGLPALAPYEAQNKEDPSK